MYAFLIKLYSIWDNEQNNNFFALSAINLLEIMSKWEKHLYYFSMPAV